jgi:IstB-like ATP binding protein
LGPLRLQISDLPLAPPGSDDSGQLRGITSTDHAALVAARRRIAELETELALFGRAPNCSRRRYPRPTYAPRFSSSTYADVGIGRRSRLPTLGREEANMVFQLVSRRYERGSIILTSNKAFSEWGQVFSDEVLATVI